MARTAFDAYLHELISLRSIPPYVRFGIRKRLSAERWRLVADARQTLLGTTRESKKHYADIRELSLVQKLQTLLLSLQIAHASPLVANFEQEFNSLILLNALRNAIVHHDFEPPLPALLRLCNSICDALQLRRLEKGVPWETLFEEPSVATWACFAVCRALLAIEEIEHNRTIHFSATKDSLRAAISPLNYE